MDVFQRKCLLLFSIKSPLNNDFSNVLTETSLSTLILFNRVTGIIGERNPVLCIFETHQKHNHWSLISLKG
jgi:hypothetical protein